MAGSPGPGWDTPLAVCSWGQSWGPSQGHAPCQALCPAERKPFPEVPPRLITGRQLRGPAPPLLGESGVSEPQPPHL